MGFISSFHCVGMCGPLLMALPVKTMHVNKQTPAIVIYHAGRISIYMLFGLLTGMAGRRIYTAGLQHWVSISAGIIILAFVLKQKFAKKLTWQPGTFLFSAIQKNMRRLWQKTSFSSFFLLGALNGLLPCGMVYFALAAALNFGTVSNSVLFMLAFGAATLPLLGIVHYAGNRFINIRARNTIRKSVPVLLGCVGVLLVLRGLNLGIPYISPFLGKQPANIVSCH